MLKKERNRGTATTYLASDDDGDDAGGNYSKIRTRYMVYPLTIWIFFYFLQTAHPPSTRPLSGNATSDLELPSRPQMMTEETMQAVAAELEAEAEEAKEATAGDVQMT